MHNRVLDKSKTSHTVKESNMLGNECPTMVHSSNLGVVPSNFKLQNPKQNKTEFSTANQLYLFQNCRLKPDFFIYVPLSASTCRPLVGSVNGMSPTASRQKL